MPLRANSFEDIHDRVLIERARAGDAGAFDRLTHKHYPLAYRYAQQLTKHCEDAEDIVAEGFVRAYQAIGQFNFDSCFSTWLFTIQRNCFFAKARKQKLKIAASIDALIGAEIMDGVVSQMDDSEQPFELAVSAIRSERVRDAIARLRAEQGQVVNLCHGEMKSYRRVANDLAIAEGTVKSRLNRAKMALRDDMISVGDPMILEFAG